MVSGSDWPVAQKFPDDLAPLICVCIFVRPRRIAY